MGHRELNRVRRIALSFPEVNERLSHGEPCFFVRNQRPLCYFHDDHNGDGRISLWCPAPLDLREELVTTEPERFFKPPTSGARSVLGLARSIPRPSWRRHKTLERGQDNLGGRVPYRRP